MAIIDLREECNYLLGEIEKNCRKAAMTRSQIERLQSIKTGTRLNLPIDIHDDDTLEEIEEEDDEFEDEVGYYLSDYRDLEYPFTIDDFHAILPKRSNYHFQEIISRLQAESIREMKEINEIMMESEDISEEELREYQQLLSAEKEKIVALRDYSNPSSYDDTLDDEQNQIILVPTLSGNIRILDELEKIPKEYYPDFYELIQSIIDGSFKGVKRFTNNRALVGMSEVKAFKVRVVFSRLNKNSYALITAFMKKTDNSKLYQESLRNKVSEFHKVEEFLKNSLFDEGFIEENEKNVLTLMNLLTGDKEDKMGCIR